jgi:glycerophosphoryl diester phosphodiesterase
MVSSFRIEHLVAAKRRMPGVWTHFFLEHPLPEGFWSAEGRFVNSIGVPWEHVSPELVAIVHGEGRGVWTFTVDDPGIAVSLAGAGVEAITTNDPVGIRSALAKAGH